MTGETDCTQHIHDKHSASCITEGLPKLTSPGGDRGLLTEYPPNGVITDAGLDHHSGTAMLGGWWTQEGVRRSVLFLAYYFKK